MNHAVLINTIVPGCLRNNPAGTQRPGNVADFLASVKESIALKQKKGLNDFSGLTQSAPARKTGCELMETLRRRLLTKGSPLNALSMDNNGSSALKTFLSNCGFSGQDIEEVFEGISDNFSTDIDLSRIFRRVAQLEASGKEHDQPVCLDISVVPHMEALLEAFGLSPKQVDDIFTCSRTAEGNLDMGRFVSELRQTCGRIGAISAEGRGPTVDGDTFVNVLEKIEGAGENLPAGEIFERFTIKDLIASLERIKGGESGVVRSTGKQEAEISRIVETVSVKAETDTTVPPLDSLSKLRLSALCPEENSGKKVDIKDKGVFPSLSENGPGKKGVPVPVAGREEKPDISKRSVSLEDVTFSPAAEGAQDEAACPGSLKNSALYPGTDSGRAVSEPISPDMPVKAGQGPDANREPFPAYLINQVGRQISRSILRGDRVVRLQLHPPELGGMKMDLEIKDRILRLGIVIESSTVKELMLSNAHELKQSLLEQGIRLDRLDVQIDHNFDQSLNTSKEYSDQKQKWGGTADSVQVSGEGGSEDAQLMHRVITGADRLVDLVA